jgi:hypothetical protein
MHAALAAPSHLSRQCQLHSACSCFPDYPSTAWPAACHPLPPGLHHTYLHHTYLHHTYLHQYQPPPSPHTQVPLAQLGTLDQQYWSELHAPGEPEPFKVRGASYLTDRRKVDAGHAEFCLAAVDLVITGTALHHVSRFLPSVRRNRAPFSFVLNLIIPGTPMLSLVLVFVNEHHPDILGQVPPDPSSSDHDWQPFDFLLYRWVGVVWGHGACGG